MKLFTLNTEHSVHTVIETAIHKHSVQMRQKIPNKLSGVIYVTQYTQHVYSCSRQDKFAS